MSKETVKKFFRSVQENARLRNQVATLMCERRRETPSALARKIVEIGAEAGLAFTDAELRAVYMEMLGDGGGNRELTEDEMGAVAGGGGMFPSFFEPGDPVRAVFRAAFGDREPDGGGTAKGQSAR